MRVRLMTSAATLRQTVRSRRREEADAHEKAMDRAVFRRPSIPAGMQDSSRGLRSAATTPPEPRITAPDPGKGSQKAGGPGKDA